MRDYVAWHAAYDDPTSSMSWRLQRVRGLLGAELDRREGRTRVTSVCAGDGRDVIGVLSRRADAPRVHATLLEVHPDIVATARTAASDLPNVEIRPADAGMTDSYAGAAPADVLLLVGVFGNISDADVERLVRAVPTLCSRGALVLWSRGLAIDLDGVSGNLNDDIRRWFAEAGCVEESYEVFDGQSTERSALGAARFTGDPQPLVPGRPLFTFLR